MALPFPHAQQKLLTHFSHLCNPEILHQHRKAHKAPTLAGYKNVTRLRHCDKRSDVVYKHKKGSPFGLPLIIVWLNLHIKLRLKTNYQVVIVAETSTTRDRITGDDVLLEVNQVIRLSLDSCLVKNLSSLLERCCRDEA